MESLWKQTSEKPDFPDRQLPKEAEAVVIGAGMAGILTAWSLEELGIQTIVLEADAAGSGQTGNTTAKITSQHGLIYDKLIQTMGEEKAGQYLQANEQAIHEYESMIKALKIECGWEKCPAYIYTNGNTEALKKEAEAAEKLGKDASYIKEIELPVKSAGAVCFPFQAQFHPLQFLYAVAGRLSVYEHVKVLEADGHTITTDQGEIKARHIVFASHYPFINRPGYYFMRMHQERSYAAAFEGAKKLNGMYWGAEEDELSYRSAEGLLLVGGGGHRTGENNAGGQYEMLKKSTEEYWTDSRIRAQWSAQDCMTLDGVPYIGAFSSAQPDWYVATGFGKWGMTSSMAAAKIISREIAGLECEYKEVFSPQRFKPSASMQNFIKDGIHTAEDFSRRFLVSADARIEEILPGHGGIIEEDGEKAGVYKDKQGIIHMVSVKCPHLGCQLSWNAEEKSWDCPCHGSRFDYDGHLLDDPAQTDLERKSSD